MKRKREGKQETGIEMLSICRVPVGRALENGPGNIIEAHDGKANDSIA